MPVFTGLRCKLCFQDVSEHVFFSNFTLNNFCLCSLYFHCHCCISTGIRVGFEELTYQVNENGGSIQVCAMILDREMDTDVVVNIQTSDDTAVSGSDYTALLNESLAFEAPNTHSCVSISIDNDQVYEDMEEFLGTLTSPDQAQNQNQR